MHFEKYHKNQLTKIFQHYTREHITKNVDRERMKDNIYYCNPLISKWSEMEQKKIDSNFITDFVALNVIERQKRKFREDQVLMVDLIITQPEYLGQKCNKEFFDKCINVLNSDYVKSSDFLYYAIHNDEQGQPHLHYSFMPFTKDKKGNDKLCAKEILTRDFLKTFHKEMEQKTGYALTKDDNIKRNLSMQEYQQKEEIKKQQERIKENESKIKNNANIISEQEKKLDNKLKDKEEKLKEYNDTIDRYDSYFNSHGRIELKKPEELKKITFQPKDTVLFNVNDYNNLLKQVRDLEFATSNDYRKRFNEKDSLDKQIKKQENYLSELKNNDFTSLKNEIKSRENRIKELHQEINSKDIDLRASKTLLEKAEQKSKNMYNSWLLEKNENDAIKSVLKDNNILDKVMNLVKKILHPGNENLYER